MRDFTYSPFRIHFTQNSMDFVVILQLVFYCVVAVVGFIGNVATILAIRRYSALVSILERTSLSIITMLCVCDLFVCGFVVPIRIVNTIVGHNWPFSDDILCGIFWNIGYPATFASVWIMLNLALTRLFAVFWPLKYEAWLNKEVVRWSLFLFPWIISYIPQTIAFIRSTTTATASNDDLQLCTLNSRSKQTLTEFKWLMITVTFLEVFAPLTIGGLIYIATCVKLYAQHRTKMNVQVHNAINLQPTNRKFTASRQVQQQQAVATSTSTKQRRMRAVKLMALTYLAYMVCVYPRQILAGLIHPEPRPKVLYIVVDVLFYMSFMISPLVYLATMAEMRQAYKKMGRQLTKCCSVKV